MGSQGRRWNVICYNLKITKITYCLGRVLTTTMNWGTAPRLYNLFKKRIWHLDEIVRTASLLKRLFK